MKKYKVSFWYTVYGTVEMEAKSEKEAEKKVEETLKTNGLEDLSYKQHDLEVGAQDAELVKKK